MTEKRKPAYLQTTRKCNQECVFCSNPQFDKEYTLEEAKKAVIEFKKQKVTEIMLTGGEPTLVSFLLELIKFTLSQNIQPKLITNGILLEDKGLVKSLYNSGLRHINVSIHTTKEETFDKMSNKKGHLKKAIKGIRNCLNSGITLNINSTINSLNCKELSSNTLFFINKFPQINHFVFNNLDIGFADGENISRAAKNKWIIAKLTDMELELSKTAKLLEKHNKTYRIERVPLCYMAGFEHNSTETRKIIKNEEYMCYFIEKNKKTLRIIPAFNRREKVKACSVCNLNPVCAGLQKDYIDVYGSGELFPSFENPEKVIHKIRNE